MCWWDYGKMNIDFKWKAYITEGGNCRESDDIAKKYGHVIEPLGLYRNAILQVLCHWPLEWELELDSSSK